MVSKRKSCHKIVGFNLLGPLKYTEKYLQKRVICLECAKGLFTTLCDMKENECIKLFADHPLQIADHVLSDVIDSYNVERFKTIIENIPGNEFYQAKLYIYLANCNDQEKIKPMKDFLVEKMSCEALVLAELHYDKFKEVIDEVRKESE